MKKEEDMPSLEEVCSDDMFTKGYFSLLQLDINNKSCWSEFVRSSKSWFFHLTGILYASLTKETRLTKG